MRSARRRLVRKERMTVLAVLPTSASIAPAQLSALGDDFVLASWESDGPETSGRVVPSLDGEEVRPPYTTLSVRTSWGGQRVLSILRTPRKPGATARFIAQGRVIAEAQAEPESPDLDPAFLLGSLDATARLRVVRFLFDFARSTPSLRSDAGFAGVCRRMVLELSPTPSPVTARATATDELLLCGGSLSSGFGEVTGAVIITPGAVGPAPFEVCVGSTIDRRGRTSMDLLVDRALCLPGNLLVLLGRNGLACRAFGAVPPTLPALTEHLGTPKRDTPLALRQYILRGLAQRGRSDATAAAAVRELQVLVPLPKRQVADAKRSIGASLDLAVPTGDGGLFLAGWVHDPHGLSNGLSVQTPFGGERRLEVLEHRFPREDVAKLFKSDHADRSGFIAYLPGAPEPAASLQVHAELLLGSGGSIKLVPPLRPMAPADARAAVLGSLPPHFATPHVLETVIGPAVAPLHAAHMATRREPEMVVFGKRPENPTVSVIIPLYKTLEFLRFQLSSFATDPGMDEAELIFVLDSPEQRDELVHMLHGFHGLYGLPMVLLVQSANYGYSAANNAGAAASHARKLLFLNSDVIPDRPGWLGDLVAALEERRGTGAVGPKLLFDDDSLQHAGLYFDRDVRGRWFNHHFFKGMPRDFLPACRARSVPGVTGACLLMSRTAFEAVGGFCEDYVIGDFEDSDLCLRIRGAGLDIRYVPSVELYHLERRSISKHQGYTRGVASEYNCWLHARRWSALMEELTARDWDEDSPPPPPSLGPSFGPPCAPAPASQPQSDPQPSRRSGRAHRKRR
ncbi:glycosyltransferase family 2 protein [Azospirillum soli]|uniref:glycosyltransferase family 2 protein n=1 Tax=Azospirillum soli TaxID=1304799 RepID=UPI0031B7F3F5|nr:GT2 family glycosyltransferase [Azospirillum soli]